MTQDAVAWWEWDGEEGGERCIYWRGTEIFDHVAKYQTDRHHKSVWPLYAAPVVAQDDNDPGGWRAREEFLYPQDDRRDAERYRWLRENAETVTGRINWHWQDEHRPHPPMRTLDAAIDAAMSEQTKDAERSR